MSREQIKSYLLTNNWQAQDIEEAFSSISSGVTHSSSVLLNGAANHSFPGAIATFKQAFIIYKQRFGVFLVVMIIPAVASLAIVGVMILGISLIPSILAAGGIGLLIFLAVISYLIILISQIWGMTALLYAIKDNQEKIGIIELYRKGWNKILSYWWISFLVVLINFIGFLLLVVPGIIFMVWFSLAPIILIAEDIKGRKALSRSKDYVRGQWGGVLWRLFFIWATYLIIYYIPTLIFSFLKIPFGSEISTFIGLLMILIFMPLAMTYLFFVYLNLRALKKG